MVRRGTLWFRSIAGPFVGTWVRRIGWSVVAQGASSIPNFGLYAVMASTLTPSNFGRFVALMAVYHLVLAVARSAIFETFVTDSVRSVGRARFTGRSSQAVALALGGSVAIAVVGVMVGSPRSSWLVMGASMLPLLVQDGLRHLGWASGRVWFPVALDVLWTAVFATGLVVRSVQGESWMVTGVEAGRAESFVLGFWVAGGVAGAVVGSLLWALLNRLPPVSVDSPSKSVGEVDSSAVRLMGRSQAIQSTAFNLLPLVIAVAVSPAAASAIKAVLLPFTPILTTVAGTRLVTLPAMRRAVAEGRLAIDRLTVSVVGVGAGFAVVGGLGIVAVLTWLPLGAPGSALEYSRTVVWWGLAITTMSVVNKFLADALALGRRNVPVIWMRLAALSIEWAVLVAVVSTRPGANVAVVWAVGLALGSLVWIAPTVVGRPGPPTKAASLQIAGRLGLD